jgi:hypothetical protein
MCIILKELESIQRRMNMDVNEFWNLVMSTHKNSLGNPDKQADLLVKELTNRSVQDILDYGSIFKMLMDRAYLADLWAAAAVIDPWGCSEDGFMDFRAWLIAQGKATYESALLDPETLVDFIDVGTETQIEKLSHVPVEAYLYKTGQEELPPNIDYTAPQLYGKLPQDRAHSMEKFPRLSAKFGYH